MIVIITTKVRGLVAAYGNTQKSIRDAVLKAERGLKIAD